MTVKEDLPVRSGGNNPDFYFAQILFYPGIFAMIFM
jgi:hypothetical protein